MESYRKVIQSGTLIEEYTYERPPSKPLTTLREPSKPRLKGFRRARNIKSARKVFSRLVRANIKPDSPPVLLTLTMRDVVDISEAYKNYSLFFKRMRTAWGGLSWIGVPEFQKRGAPHFHILAWLAKEVSLEWVRERLSQIWSRVICQRSAANLEHGCTVEPVTDFRACSFYMSVYQSKDSQDRKDIATGREWGAWHKERLGLEPVKDAILTEGETLLVRRSLRRMYVSFMRRCGKSGHAIRRSSYFRALSRDQPFTNFLPLHTSNALLEWVKQQYPF